MTPHALEPEPDCHAGGHAGGHAGAASLVGHGLVGGELAALQLYARGYSPAQIASLRAMPIAVVVADLRRIVWALGTGTLGDAIGEARYRGLIV